MKDPEEQARVPEHQIPLATLLNDAANALESAGLHGMARAVQMANTMLSGDPPTGEAFIADVVEVLDAVESLGAEQDCGSAEDIPAYYFVHPEPMERLAAAMERVQTWGLTPERRSRSALKQLVLALERIREVATRAYNDEGADRGSDGAALAEIKRIARHALDTLGFVPEPEKD